MARKAISIEEQIDRQEAVVLAMKKKMDDMKAKYEAERDRKNDETGREEKAD